MAAGTISSDFGAQEKKICQLLLLVGLVGLDRTVQLQLLQCYWLGHRLGLL